MRHADADRLLNELIRTLTGAEEPETVEPIDDVEDDEMISLEDECAAAESILKDVMAENGMALLASKQDIREIHDRLDRIERMIAEMASLTTAH